MTLDFDRHCAEIVTQTSLLVGHLDCADLTVPVPTCPGWNVSQLARHAATAASVGVMRSLAGRGRASCARGVVSGRRKVAAPRSTPAGSPTTAMHRAAAALALGVQYTLALDVAADGIDEWMELGCMPFHFEVHPWMRELLGPGRTVGLHATDADAHWLLDLTGDVIAWQRADKQAAAEIRAPVTDLLLTIYRRRRVAGLDVTGDAKLVDFWLERVAFG
jgi:hypothetical protein